MIRVLIFNLVIFFCVIEVTGQQFKSLEYPVIAHAHNDYEQAEPINTALENNFDAFEVDIFYHQDKLVISHDEDRLDEKMEFSNGYLIPLITALESSTGTKVLLIDIKNYSAELLQKLNEELEPHSSILLKRNDEDAKSKKLQILLSGKIPRKEIINDRSNQFLFIDGRITDLEFDYSKNYMPWVSMDITDITLWKGKDIASKRTMGLLESNISYVHSKGKLFRFWKTNETELMWKTLIDLEVDIIGVDNLCLFNQIFQEQK